MNSEYAKLYDPEDRSVMKIAEDALNPREDRVNEIILYAKEAGIKRIGIANCIVFEREADELELLLTSDNFSVYRANCKLGRMPFDDILSGYKGVSCNPAGQAMVLADSGTELNVVMGLCLGHDMVFYKKSQAWTTTLLIKDRKPEHHTLQRFDAYHESNPSIQV